VHIKTVIILNPNAGAGRAIHEWRGIEPKISFLKPYELFQTKQKGDGIALAQKALKQGAQRMIVAGGDGSLNEVVNGFFENEKPISEDARLGILPLGSGCDFAKTLGIFSIEDALQKLKTNQVKLSDVGHVQFKNKEGQDVGRFFINISSFGCSAKAAHAVNASKKRLGSKLTYLWISLKTFLTYKNPKVMLSPQGEASQCLTMNSVFVCNGKYAGAGMQWGPKAKIDDGLLDVTLVKDLPCFTGLLNFHKIYLGKTYELSDVEHLRCDLLRAKSFTPVMLEVDGEDVGTLPATFTILKHAIQVIGLDD